MLESSLEKGGTAPISGSFPWSATSGFPGKWKPAHSHLCSFPETQRATGTSPVFIREAKNDVLVKNLSAQKGFFTTAKTVIPVGLTKGHLLK